MQQLAIPPTIPITRTATNIVQTLNWNQTSDPPANVPGLCPATEIKNIAVESLAYLELTPGLHRFHIVTDDRAGLYSGVNFTDPNAAILWENTDNTANTTFDFVVEAAGLYPLSCIWEQTGGGALLQLYSVNLGDLTEVLINDSTDPAGVVKAWYPIVCKSSASVTGPFTVAAGAVNTLNQSDIVGSDCAPTVVGHMVTGGTFTVPISGTVQYYVLDAPRATKITGFTKGASNLVITYTVK
jgi:roadblock/LC7 domain-containing protein